MWYANLDICAQIGLGEPLLRLPYMGLQMKIGFVTITVMEILAPLCLVSRWFRYAFLAALMGFHVLIMLTMKIPFLENVLLMAFLIDWNGRRG